MIIIRPRLVKLLFILLYLITFIAPIHGAELKQKATLADYANYTGHLTGTSLLAWDSFLDNSPGMIGVAKDSLNGIIIHEQLSKGDAKGAFMTLFNFTAGFLADQLHQAGYGPLGNVKTLIEAYIAANDFLHNYYFIPTLVDGIYRGYKRQRDSGETHAQVWDVLQFSRATHPLIADAKKQAIHPRYNVQKGVNLSETTRKASGSAADREIQVTYHHKDKWPYKRPQLIRHKGKTGTPRFLSIIDIELTGDHKKALPSLMLEITRLNERYRDKGKYMSQGDLMVVEKELSRLLDESASAAEFGKKINTEAVKYVGAMLDYRYNKEKLSEHIRWLGKKSSDDLKRVERAFKTFNWAKRLTIRAKNTDGAPGKPIASAAIIVDGKLCTSKTNAGKPCGSGPDGNVSVHLTGGLHRIKVKVPGYKSAELNVTARTPSVENPEPEEYSVLLSPRDAGRLVVKITSGDEGQPLSAASVMLTSLGDGPVLISKTGTDGKTAFDKIPPENIYLMATSAAYHHAQEPIQVNLEESSGQMSVALQPILSSAEILVLGPDNEPVQSASVNLGDKQATTNHEGLALFQDILPTPREGYSLTAFMPGLSKTTSKLKVHPVDQGLRLKSTLKLSLDGSIIVMVRDTQDRLVPNAMVRLEGAQSPQVKRVTSANGMVAFSGLMTGAYYINASAKNYTSGVDREIIITPDNLKQKAKFILTSGMKLKVIVVDQDGNTIPAKISIDGDKLTNAPTGVITLKGVMPGKHMFTIRAKGFPPIKKEYTADPTNPKLTIKLGADATQDNAFSNINSFVAFLFRSILDREASEEEMLQVAEVLRNGKSPEWVIMQFFLSEEYKNNRKSNREFIRDVYQGVLAREPDTSGWSFWDKQLNTSSRKRVIERFFDSPEYKCTHRNAAQIRRCQGRRL